jgi:hypothetical protein
MLPRSYQRKLIQLKFLRERPDYHPEESAFEHIRIVTERLLQTGDPDLVAAGIIHDIFKFDCVQENKKTGYPTSPGHDAAAAKAVREDDYLRAFCLKIGADPEKVAWLCEQHMRVKQIGEMRPAKSVMITEHELYPSLVIFSKADDMLGEWKYEYYEKI